VATTIKLGFDKLKQNLQITDLQGSTVSTRQTNVRDAVKAELTVLDDFLTGSYKRSTMIAPLTKADIDIFMVLDPKYYKQNGQTYILDKVRDVLKETYPKSPKVSRDGQAVTITFTDFKVDVVPAFKRQGGGYLIPDCILSRWIPTDPKEHVTIWSAANAAHNGDLVPLIKIIKAWNRSNGDLLQSFHLESMVLQILNGMTISNFWSGARYVFDKGRTVVESSVLDPAGYGSNTGAYLNTQAKLDAVVSRFDTAYARAINAEGLENQGKIEDAFSKWQLVFGSYFPAYG
jgi:hypothetical protein